ncbi:MAG: hypothetical protein LBK73_06450 [Treponema sp.]|jgi:hypothetical protein|nr:hypothetical protein [Treponema sp.]
MARNDWIPGREQDIVDLCRKWKRALEDPVKVAAYGWDDPDEVAVVLAAINAFLAAREVYEADNSTVKRLVKDKAKEETIDAMRDFANTSIRFNKKMDDAANMNRRTLPARATHGRLAARSPLPASFCQNRNSIGERSTS